jgi:threonine dehydratase
MRASLDEFFLVDDSAIDAAIVALLDHRHLLVEPAGAAAFAQQERIRGKRVVLVCSSANITREHLGAILESAER